MDDGGGEREYVRTMHCVPPLERALSGRSGFYISPGARARNLIVDEEGQLPAEDVEMGEFREYKHVHSDSRDLLNIRVISLTK
jgi:hypothetical protein